MRGRIESKWRVNRWAATNEGGHSVVLIGIAAITEKEHDTVADNTGTEADG